MTAGLVTLQLISEPGFFVELGEKTRRLTHGLRQRAHAAGVSVTTNQVGGMFGLFFTDAGPVTDYAGSTACDIGQFRTFYHAMLERGVYLAPSAFEAGFVSSAHGEQEINATLDAAAEAFGQVAGNG